MATNHRGITGRVNGANEIGPLAVSPRQACFLLSVGTTRLYELIRAGELEAYHEGRARRITMRSIRARVAQLTATTESQVATPRRRGRPRKNAVTP
jgi:excisionase family DNA binding protein